MHDIERGQSILDQVKSDNAADRFMDSLSDRDKADCGWQYPVVIDDNEWTSARSTPDCIVENYLYADVGVFFAPGGTGKTTLILFEAVHIAIGRHLWGLEIRKAGPVVILTAEDTREMLIARLREIVKSMGLSDSETVLVRQRVLISDVCANPVKLTAVFDDVVRPNYVVDEIIHASKDSPPVLIVIDPAVSFGVGESRVNDAEQGLIEAGRKLRNALNCCVRYIHHTGKANGREKSLDQYSGRGGSAFSDGARMVTVMQRYDEDEWRKLTGKGLAEGESGLILARPKLSYAPPQPELFVVREGYGFELVTLTPKNPMADLEAVANQVWQLIGEETRQGRNHSRNTIEALATAANLKRQELRDALSFLISSGRVEEVSNRLIGKQGGRCKHLFAVDFGSPKPFGEAIDIKGQNRD